MTLFVLAYPELSAADAAWVQEIRRQHDPNHARVAPHFTLVFGIDGIDGIDVAKLAAHVAEVAAGAPSIGFTLRSARAVAGDFDDDSYVYLLPEEGYGDIVALYDRLHAGPLERVTQPTYVPHITVGRFGDAEAAASLATDLGCRAIEIAGMIETLTVARREHGAVTTLKDIDLKRTG